MYTVKKLLSTIIIHLILRAIFILAPVCKQQYNRDIMCKRSDLRCLKDDKRKKNLFANYHRLFWRMLNVTENENEQNVSLFHYYFMQLFTSFLFSAWVTEYNKYCLFILYPRHFIVNHIQTTLFLLSFCNAKLDVLFELGGSISVVVVVSKYSLQASCIKAVCFVE